MNRCAIEIQVRSTEIDVNGHVNNAKYLEYLEWGREEWWELHGLDYDVLKDFGVLTVLVHISANYRKEAFQNDRLRIETWLSDVRNTSLTMEQTITNQHGDLVLDAQVILVTIDPLERKKVSVPTAVRAHLESDT